MKFEEALKLVREDITKCLRNQEDKNNWLYLYVDESGDMRGRNASVSGDSWPVTLQSKDLMRSEWTVVSIAELELAAPKPTFNCPRREEGFGRAKPGEVLDLWRTSHGHETCGYCGSMNPDRLMEMLEAGTATLTPTDKDYKVYVDWEGGSGKFYFQHFSEEQKVRFIELLNAKSLQLKAPGHFYRLPFFVGKA